MDPEAKAVLDWVEIGMGAAVVAAALAFLCWRWIQRRTLDDVYRKADLLTGEEAATRGDSERVSPEELR